MKKHFVHRTGKDMFDTSSLKAEGTIGEQGATLLEYMLLAALLVIVVVVVVTILGAEGSTMFSLAGSSFQGNG